MWLRGMIYSTGTERTESWEMLINTGPNTEVLVSRAELYTWSSQSVRLGTSGVQVEGKQQELHHHLKDAEVKSDKNDNNDV